MMDALPQIYLASTSPRRRALLEQIGVGYRSVLAAVDETCREGERPEDYVVRLALAKAHGGWRELPAGCERPVLGADTAVVVENRILGKPADRESALATLTRLSGRSHHVFSAVAMVEQGRAATRLDVSSVTFRVLTRAECEAYWDTGEPADKAGAYAIQGRGAVFVRRLEGSYSAVMGLPLFETAELLRAFGITVPGVV
ncbi:MAG: hypothetical protein B7Z66_01875 [Chromatiales bacterium 21-64-14]|nr:MAG: hypothetical protein B7Z66_01875 [Chromatiales bacterium 21-64-14]HQU14963.1 nucleoside triphosphate pyrophosphatase [Gammaproteobacteria bacterium]